MIPSLPDSFFRWSCGAGFCSINSKNGRTSALCYQREKNHKNLKSDERSDDSTDCWVQRFSPLFPPNQTTFTAHEKWRGSKKLGHMMRWFRAKTWQTWDLRCWSNNLKVSFIPKNGLNQLSGRVSLSEGKNHINLSFKWQKPNKYNAVSFRKKVKKM